ncbi:MAG TPA: hypothetical protein VJL82_09800 [Rhizomicrobium sp.]|nr:hypothetical protein [Rhizomicrobium sp.]
MFTKVLPRLSTKYRRAAAVCALVAAAFSSQQVIAQPVVLLAPPGSVKKVVNGKFAAQVDNGWVIYQGTQGQPTLNFYDADDQGSFKLKTGGFGQGGAGLFFNAGGIVFAPCPVGPAPSRCSDSDSGPSGVGIGFGQATFGGAGGAAGGWVSDNTMTAHLTNPDQTPGSIAALAIDAVNGAHAVGWDINPSNFQTHAIVWHLDSAGQTYAPVSRTDLGTLGGSFSQALGISKNARYVVGMANNAANKGRAVYALSTDTAWTDITTGFPAEVIKSRAFAASNTGYVAGSATVKRMISGMKKSVDIGFVYNTNDGTVKFFEAPGYNVIPQQVLADGRVVGNLELSAPGTIKVYHPFLFNGVSLVDFGTMVLPSTGLPAYGCRVNRPNSLGELAGSCIPDNSTPYGVGGAAFYLDAASASPVFVDVNAAIHANADASTPGLAPYTIGSVTSIDDQHEITVMAVKLVSGTPNIAAFLASKPAYNP